MGVDAVGRLEAYENVQISYDASGEVGLLKPSYGGGDLATSSYNFYSG